MQMRHDGNLEHPEITRAIQFGSRWADEIDILEMSVFGSEAMQKYHAQERFFRGNAPLQAINVVRDVETETSSLEKGEELCN